MDLYTIRTQLSSGQTIYDMPLRVTYYARVSTEKDAQLHSLSAQVQYYCDFIQSIPSWTFVPGYVDEGLSGTSVGKRENFLRMIEDGGGGRFDFIVTKEISRFSRSTLDSIQYTQALLKHGVGILFQSDNINTFMPDAELRLTIMSSIAQDEVRKISERVKFGFRRAIENGVVLGNHNIWGYDKKDGVLTINQGEAELVRLIFDLYANQHMGLRTLSRRLSELGYRNGNGNDFSYSTIHHILKNPKYKGYYCGGKSTKYDYKLPNRKTFSPDQWVMYPDEKHVPPIVSEALWEKANQLLDRRSHRQRAEQSDCYQNRYPYSGKILCAQHKTPYYRQLYRYKTGDKEVWQCQEYTRLGKSGCQAPVVYTAELDDIVRQTLRHIPLDRERISQQLIKLYSGSPDLDRAEAHIQRHRLKLEELARRKDKLLDLNIDGRISDDEFTGRNDRFNLEITNLEQKIKSLTLEIARSREATQSIENLTQHISLALDFPKGFSVDIIDELANQFEILPTDEKTRVMIKINLKIQVKNLEFEIIRRRGKTSLCSLQYI